MVYWHWSHRPQNPVLRLLSAFVGLIVLAGLFVFGFFALAVLAFVGVVVYIVRTLSRPHAAATNTSSSRANTQIIEGEYVVVQPDESEPRSR